MAPKSKKTNGFFLYLMDLKKQQPQRCSTMLEWQQYAGNLWTKLSESEKNNYKQQAKGTVQHVEKEKLAADGTSLIELEKANIEQAQKVTQGRDHIRKMIQASRFDNNLPNEVFLLLHINKLLYYPKDDYYFVCEIAICPFNLQNGIDSNNIFHRIIRPGKLPLGYRFDAKIYSENTHELMSVIYDGDDCDYNVNVVVSDMMDFLRKYRSRSGTLPPLFTDDNDLPMMENVLNGWYEELRLEGAPFTVYGVQYFLHTLRNSVANRTVWASEERCYTELKNDTFFYSKGTACTVHDAKDSIIHCSRSIVIRTCYVICDLCCPDLKIELIPGAHIPKDYVRSTNRNETVDDDEYNEELDTAEFSNSTTCKESTEVLTSYTGAFNPLKASSDVNSVQNDRDDWDNNRNKFNNLKFPTKGYDLHRNP